MNCASNLTCLNISRRNIQPMYSYILLNVCTVIACQAVTLRSIRPNHDVRCRISVMDVALTPADPKEKSHPGSLLYETQTMGAQYLNCSIVYLHNLENGYPDAYGNYSGMIGLLQRDEADVSGHGSRSDAFEYQPVIVGPAFDASEAIILTIPAEDTDKTISVTEVFRKMDSLTYYYFGITMFICNVLLVVTSHKNCRVWRRKRYFMRIVRRFRKSTWAIFELLVDQENSNFKYHSQRILWFSICISVLGLIFGYLLNLTSTDLIAVIPTETIDSVDDIFEPKFYSTPSVIMKNYATYNILKKANANSSLGRLYIKLLEQGDRYTVRFDYSQMSRQQLSQGQEFLNELFADRINLIVEQYVMDSMRISMCFQLHEVVSRSHTSSSFAEGTQNILFSRYVDHRVRRYLERKANVITQSGLHHIMHKNYVIAYQKSLGLPLSWEAFKCINNLNDNVEQAEIQMPLRSVILVFKLSAVALIIALIILVLELMYKKTFNSVHPSSVEVNSTSWVTQSTQMQLKECNENVREASNCTDNVRPHSEGTDLRTGVVLRKLSV